VRSQVEALLREKKLDRTLLTSSVDAELSREERDARLLATGWASVDEALRGGFPRGECSEIVGSSSSGRTALGATLLAEATRRGEIVALVDTLDRFDPRAAAALDVDLSRLLWVRGTALSPQALSARAPGIRQRRTRVARGERGEHAAGAARAGRAEDDAPDLVARVIERALKSFGLIAQAGGFGVVLLDLGEVPMSALRRLPFTTWFRLQRLIEGSQTVGLLLAQEPIGRSARGLTVRVGTKETTRVIWTGTSHYARVLTGFALKPQVLSARRLSDRLHAAAPVAAAAAI
jgi:recombination protein RecA